MSHNDPGDFEKEFLDSDVDLRIAHLSPGAEIYSRSSSSEPPSLRAVFVFLILIGGAVGGNIFMLISKGLKKGSAVCRLLFWQKKRRLRYPPKMFRAVCRASLKI